MGLLGKALEYKKEINRKGKVTLLDTITGPAETEMLDDEPEVNTLEKNTFNFNEPAEEVRNNIRDDLFDLPEDDNYSPLDALKALKSEQTDSDPDNLKTDREKTTKKNVVPTQYDFPNPLSAEDEPILPKDIDAVISSGYVKEKDTESKAETSGELLEIEPYIIPEDNYHKTGLAENQINGPVTESNLHGIDATRKYSGEFGSIPGKKYNEDMTLYEIGKEISRSSTKKELFEVVIFSIMGQIGTSSASILIKNPENDKWIIVNSNGLKSVNKTFAFETTTGIFKTVKKDIIDIEKFKNDPDYNNNYMELTSIGIRLLIPWFFKGRVFGILALGNKITDEDYTAEEKEFIQAICEASAIEFNKINTIETIKTENESSRTGLEFIHHVNSIQEKIITNNSLKKIKDIIASEFQQLGIMTFSVFSHDKILDKYIPVITSKKPVHDIKLSIVGTEPFISFINQKIINPRIPDFHNSEIIKTIFKETELKKMDILWIYPTVVGGHLIGFIIIFKVNDELLNNERKIEIDTNFDKLSKMILLNIINIMHIDPDENRYMDNIGILFKRIDSELANAKRLAIPLTLALFSIKNYKRYGNVFGYEKAKELINNFAKLIKSRLSETDFSARFDRNKILVIFPGKDKKFVATFTNTIRNEFMQSFKKNEMQLLITFLLAEYPEDGDDMLSLMDSIE
ncbi:MAG: diguanylate cyclase [Spirochaetes bacterium]|nr:diguanylate cyclase [Spirochaetota bacterium]